MWMDTSLPGVLKIACIQGRDEMGKGTKTTSMGTHTLV